MSNGPTFTAGALLFVLGTITIMVVTFANGGVRKSKQFKVLSDVLAGRAGTGARVAMIVGFCSVGVGTCTTFAGVSIDDRARARRCAAACTARGYREGVIRASTARNPQSPKRASFVACACSQGPPLDPLELRADSL